MNGRQEIEQRRGQVAAICREHEVARPLVFSSVLRDDFDPETSDIDFPLDFQPGVNNGWLNEYTELEAASELLFDRKVDVITAEINRNRFLKAAVEQEKELLYAA